MRDRDCNYWLKPLRCYLHSYDRLYEHKLARHTKRHTTTIRKGIKGITGGPHGPLV
jgi:hypothetical protein